MPRYFFHIDDGSFVPDNAGTVLPDVQSARGLAVKSAGEVLADLDGEFWQTESQWRMHVTDEVGRLQFALHFSSEVPSGEVMYVPRAKGGRKAE